MGQNKIISELMESIVNEIAKTLSSKDKEVDNEDFLVHSKLLKDVHLELRVKLLLPQKLQSDIMEMYKTRYHHIHKKKLTRVHHNLLLSHVHYDLDSVLNYSYCQNVDCTYDHDENEFNVLNKESVEGKVLNIKYNYCCKHCYSYDMWSKEDDFKKLWNRNPERCREILQQRANHIQDSIQLDNFRIFINEDWEI